ncbi:MAG TPA: hypothetical protein DCP90_00500 [Clostridiales bacterium]|nr:MAG: hypothetical protein A2Y22_08335 [Clostridiales bacterium GWD2_32_59]HAN09076.1 hypothetical protein [Clostridiales bacterium]
MFEPKFYENKAMIHLSKMFDKNICRNFRYSANTGPIKNLPEIDGILEKDHKLYAIEAKSFIINQEDLVEIMYKYKLLGFRRLIIISPDYTKEAIQLTCSQSKFEELILEKYSPDLQSIDKWYKDWNSSLPPQLEGSLSSGRHSFRFILSKTNTGKRIVVNQVSSRITCIYDIKKEIERLSSPPVKVLWSTQKWTIPKDLYFRNNKLVNLGGFVVIDLDGQKMHSAFFDCELSACTPNCMHCYKITKKEMKIAYAKFAENDIHPSFVTDSGNHGFHMYIDINNYNLAGIREILNRHEIRYDKIVFDNNRAFVAFPTSLNGETNLPIRIIKSQEASSND